MKKDIPVGVEQVLILAAREPAFQRALLRDRQEALQDRGLVLEPSEQAMLAAVPAQQLQAAVASVDVSPENVERRGFLRVVAAGAMTVAAAEALAACGDDADTGIRPDTGVRRDFPYAGLPDRGIPDRSTPDRAVDHSKPPDAGTGDGSAADDADKQDKTWLDLKASWGSRPNG